MWAVNLRDGVDSKIGYYLYNNQVYYHNDDWAEIESVDLPEDFSHPSTVNDFYFTPEWDSSTQFTDFEDTSFYQDAHKSDDSDYDWDSSDSWNSNSTDWDSN